MQMHVAEINFTDFYSSAFPSRDESRAFVECVEAIPVTTSKAKIAMHQAARMIWLADRLEEVARGRPALQILFYLIAAETVAKTVAGFTKTGKVKFHVCLFFEQICSDRHRDRLRTAFLRDGPGPPLSVGECVDLLYKVRCQVAHEAVYFNFHLRIETDRFPMISPTPDDDIYVIPQITTLGLRQVILEGALLGAKALLPPDSPCIGLAPAI